VIVDFSKVPMGKHVYLVNRFEQLHGREPENYLGSGPDGVRFGTLNPGHAVMRFDVVLNNQGDPSQLPTRLRELPWDPNDALSKLSESTIRDAVGRTDPFPGVARVREWRFDRSNGQWTVNGQIYDGSRPAATVGKDTGEIWILEGGGSWVHPVHMHYEEHRTLFRNGVRPGPQHLEYGRDDTMTLGAGERGILFRRFRDWKGKYVMHCHNTVHEDHAMMVRFDVV
jgi:FtsP/CotA-like multicopper oxidase with cupredoxin domain